MAIVFPKNNQIKGVKGSFQQSGATRDVSSSAKKNISTASHTSIFGGLHAKHSPNWVAGVKVSGDISKNDFQSVRFQRNSRTFRMNTGGFGTNIVSKQTVKTDNSFMTGSLIGQIVNGAFGTLNKILDANAATTTKKTDKPSTDGTRDGQSVGNTTTFTGKLTSSKSFTELNNLESEVKTKKESFGTDYKDKKVYNPENFTKVTTDHAEALEEAGVSLDFSSLSLSDMDMNDIDKSLGLIDDDIAKFGNYMTNELPKAVNSITTSIGKISGEISSAQIDLDKLEAQTDPPAAPEAIAAAKQKLQDLKDKKTKLENAKTAVMDLQDQCQSTMDALETKKAELKDIKNFEKEIQDKKFELAKEQDKELGKALDELKEINKELAKLTDKNGNKYDNSDDKRAGKYSQLISKKSSILSKMNDLIGSLTAAGDFSKIKSSKGQSLTISNLEPAKQYISSGGSSS